MPYATIINTRTQFWEQKLHRLLPLSRAMEVGIRELTDGRLALTVPIVPNSNDKGTGFGGSIAALGITAGWCAVMEIVERHGMHGDVVIQRSQAEYLLPATADFAAVIVPPDVRSQERFLETLKRRGRARLSVTAEIRVGEQLVARVEGDYVAVAK